MKNLRNTLCLGVIVLIAICAMLFCVYKVDRGLSTGNWELVTRRGLNGQRAIVPLSPFWGLVQYLCFMAVCITACIVSVRKYMSAK